MTEIDHTVETMYKMRTLVLFGALLPGVGCYLCVAYTYIFQFERVLNFTQGQVCPNVHNIFPPVSYSIGVWEPQRFFWLLVMFLHVPPRMFFLVLYRRLFLQSTSSTTKKYPCWFGRLTSLFMATMWLEISGLVMVTVFPVKLFWLHSSAYTVWITAFNLNVLFNVTLHHYGGLRSKLETTFWIKTVLLSLSFSLTLSTAITFPLFVEYCSNPAYVAFSLAEYSLVGLNSLYYCIIYWEFPKTRVTIGVRKGPHPRKITVATTMTFCEGELEEEGKTPV